MSTASNLLKALFCSGLMLAASLSATAHELYLSNGQSYPGQLWTLRSGAIERPLFRRQPVADPAYPRAVMKIASVAIEPDGKVYYASGLDGYVLHLLEGRHEVLSFEFPGQIRNVACSREEHTIYFSVVPTPQNGEPLADGKIYRRDLYDGQPAEVATVRQSQVEGGWWGTFAVRDGDIYLATFEAPSRIYRLTGSGPELIFSGAGFKITSLSVGPDGKFYFADGSDHVYRTENFETVDVAFQGTRGFTTVAVGPDSTNTTNPVPAP